VAAEQHERASAATTGDERRGTRRLRWVVATLVAVKLVAIALSWQDGDGLVRRVLAADAPEGAPALAVLKPSSDPSGAASVKGGIHAERARSAADVKSLLEELSRRQDEVDRREKALAAREERLALYEKDVTAKITQLESVGKSLKDELRKSTSASDEAAASLAKVYGAMKPSDAAPILDQLDEATALRILTRMKEKQVGEILPLMTRERAIVLTRSLAGRTMPASSPPKS
jgi:flagellar motility protein MotE (MotC chaperone)